MEDDICGCVHAFGPHVLVAYGDPRSGGLIFCQMQECPCTGTWGIDGMECQVTLPPPHVIAEYREAIFSPGRNDG